MALDPTQKDKIVSALAQLDHNNEGHWVEDGLPRTGVVQKFAGDQSITRQQINEAAPGFSRQVPDKEPVPEQTVPDTETTTPAEAAKHAPARAANDDGGTVLAFTEQEREKFRRAVVEAEADYNQSLKDLETMRRHVLACKAALEQAVADERAKFPPISAAQNIQNYLAASLEERRRAAGQQPQGIPANFGRGMGRRIGASKPFFFDKDGKPIQAQSRGDLARAATMNRLGIKA
jgi:hypothetical protein